MYPNYNIHLEVISRGYILGFIISSTTCTKLRLSIAILKLLRKHYVKKCTTKLILIGDHLTWFSME